MFERMMRENAPARAAIQKTKLQEIRFDHIFKRIAAFRQRGRNRIDADWSTAKIQRDAFQIAVIEAVQSRIINIQ